MDGPALIGALRRLDPTLPIIGASGLLSNGNPAAAKPEDLRIFLAKPYSAAALLTALDEVIAPRRR
jgi:hypothetical protein